ncbi:MAG: ATP-binding protein [Burkholderiales bacterium]|uniref:ATP-binding protein n=1 Tax=Inhella sp. TaxID=1921806 RepID=UPI001AC41D3A|nr:ATP-binding protein [Burkholderiales bacterium]
MDLVLERIARLLEKLTEPPTLHAPDWSLARAWRLRPQPLRLEAIRHLSSLGFDGLKEIEPQKARFRANLSAFVQGKPANHVLLSGSRGTGKSSLVKAALNEWPELRLIELAKTDLGELNRLSELLASRPERFLVFCDDLSFSSEEVGYQALKSVLDGSAATPADNMLIVATSNRRHLMPEPIKDNLETAKHGGEIHPGEAIEEKISLSERFGLWISFYPFSQDEYLAIAATWLAQHGLTMDDRMRAEALVWALERGSRSGRVAQQFARHQAGQA